MSLHPGKLSSYFMKELQPSIDDWRHLYDAAMEFKEIKCWSWMLDSDLFGVQNPANGEIGYCCITGHLGEHFALIVYTGTKGLEIYLNMQNMRDFPGDLEIFAQQKCLMASFEDRETLSEEDLAIIKKLELKFRGRNQWPQFRSYQPGYPPWHLTRDETEYLILALQQATEMSLRFKEDRDMLDPPKDGYYLVRVPRKTDDGYLWTDEWLKPEPLEEKSETASPPINEIRLQKIKKTTKRRLATWEINFFLTPTPIKEGDARPFYPYAVLCLDRRSGRLDADVIKSMDYMTAFPNSLMGFIEKAQMIPTELLVKKKEALELLGPIASRLGIKLKQVERLEMLEQAQLSMLQFFQR